MLGAASTVEELTEKLHPWHE